MPAPVKPIHPKVKAATGGGTVGGAIATIIVWALGLAGADVPALVAVAFGTLATAGSGALAGYLKR